MSVAFRRESDEEHLEPRFELPIPPGPNLVTPRGYRLIEARTEELERALTQQQPEDRRKELLRDLRYWRKRLASAQIAPPPPPGQIGIGTRVTIERNGQSRVIRIVGHDESDPASNRVAFGAPLVRALIGSQVGDEVVMPGSSDVIAVVSIEPDR